MTTAVIGTGTLGSVIARLLASGGETLRLSSADNESARMLAAEIGPAAVVAGDNRDANPPRERWSTIGFEPYSSDRRRTTPSWSGSS
jgi:pyrroline-5-carboxylate reductase